MKYVRNITNRPTLCRIDNKDWKLIPGTIYPVPDNFRFDPAILQEVNQKETQKVINKQIENVDENEVSSLKDAIKILTQETRILHKENDRLTLENTKLKMELKDLEEKLESLSNKIEEKKIFVETKNSKKKKLTMGE
jgi:ABC-type phosphate transport system auxiliary subunit